MGFARDGVEGAVRVDGGDGPGGAVAHVPAVGDAEASVVLPGDDPVPSRTGGAVLQADLGAGDLTGDEAVLAGAQIQRGDGVSVGCDQQGGLARDQVGLPGAVGGLGHRRGVAVEHPAAIGVGGDDGGVAGAESAGGVGFPAVGEAPERVEGVAGAGLDRGLGEEREPTAGVDGVELVVVPDQQQLRPGCGHVTDEGVEVRGGGKRGLIDDDEHPGAHRPRAVDLR
ncbi:MAG TPA: hypothetical protein VHU88_19990 [Sporichthyaceae bacterium]|nr:hypothetical protein [Sporichthyaceae bacterium]